MARITGVGGIFFKCADPKALSEWYRRVLGLAVEDWGGTLFQPDSAGPPHLVWSPFGSDTGYFAPSARDCMINFAVDDLDGVLARLKEHGVEIIGRDDSDANGRFAWFLDPANIKIELWEPKK
jgi:catechol 2,3-dioxygenase-like lactoylglutathione lyase family enzyme